MNVELNPEQARRILENCPSLSSALQMSATGFSFNASGVKQSEAAKQSQPKVRSGVGTELKAILAKAGFFGLDGCQCEARASDMDRLGTEWCSENIQTIAGWLEESAKARGIPFVRTAAWLLVWAAIAAAKRKSALAPAAPAP